jgi:16S rRNA (guanine(1405)-N(7))-methyltransferase
MTDQNDAEIIDRFVAEVVAARKYRGICEDTVRDVIAAALPRYKRAKDAVKSARTKLHRIQAAYLGRNAIGPSVEAVRSAFERGGLAEVRPICLDLMRDHASTRERIPILDGFYEAIFAATGKPRAILDVACGVHPLGIPWMGLAEGTRYLGYEIARDLVEDLNRFLAAVGMSPGVAFQDVLCAPPREECDLAFLMKMVPCLERRDKGAAPRLIAGLRARRVVVTFPVQSLSGRSKNMPENYTRLFAEMMAPYGWPVIHVPISGELVFVVDKSNEFP